ncbi:MAG: sensor histidine kinase [Nocardioides sp.]
MGVERESAASAASAYLDCWEVAEDLTELCEVAAQLCEAPVAAIEIVHEGGAYLVACHGADAAAWDARLLEDEDPLSAAIVAGGEDLYFENIAEDPRLAGRLRADGRIGDGHMFAAAVLRDPDGVAVGTLSVADPRVARSPERRGNTVAHRRRMLALLAHQAVNLFELSVRSDELARSNAELARSQEHLAAFAGQVSHDLKTPLSGLLAWAELLGDVPAVRDDAGVAAYVQRCEASGRQMMTLIEGLLQYAGIGGTLTPRRVPLDEAMGGVMGDLAELVANGTLRWSGVDVIADPVQLRALLQNLVQNAFTFTRAGTEPEVVVTARETPLGVEVQVADNGSGIPPERREEVLHPLARYRTDVPGNGIGLASCQRIVADHGGTLDIRARPGGGTIVVATFPHRLPAQ